MKAPQEIIDLVDRFDRNYEAYQSGKYNEMQLRREFIDPFFKALGWDVENTSGYAEAYKDVIHEDAIKIGSANKAPDYSFRIGGTRKFFVEAKKPSVNIAEEIGPAYQLRRYAWSAKLSLSILTDFEEFAVYDCRVKPDKSDKATTARIIYLNYRDYLTRWEEIAAIFSKKAVMTGSFDKYADTTRTKKGTAGVDAAFLSEIDTWRHSLAQNIALRNPKLSQRELNFAVGKTIDRIIFLRICEDRSIEPYGQLMALQNGTNIYQRLIHIYYNADDKYNSGLFHFRQEKERFEPPDDLTLTLSMDDKILKEIFKSLYYPESPYEFSVLPADILGQVYEQFLGKVIHLTAGHHAKVEDKPEVKKAGGVYYTPTYIVDYIVKNTVGKLLEGKKPGPHGSASNIRILDPACGSGSFLIGAYQCLLDWHRDRYIDDGAEKWAKGRNPALYQKFRNEWRLTTAERKRILLNNIYGVDIDAQAVEVTKLSLLLKVLEGESEETIKSAFRLFHERALPDLGNNIKCGNSLVGPDFYNNQLDFFDGEERYRINAFDWEKEFSGVFKAGGFDAVIGNPPYVQLSMFKWFDEEQKKYLLKKYCSSMGRMNTFGFFIEKGINLLTKNGELGFIIPNTITTQDYYEELRETILGSCKIEAIVNFDKLLFKGAVVENVILILQKAQSDKERTNAITSVVKLNDNSPYVELKQIKQSLFVESPKHCFNTNINAEGNLLKSNLISKTERLGEFLEVNQAIALKSDRSLWISDKKKGNNYKPLLVGGKNINKYSLEWDGTYLKYDLDGIHSCKREDIFLTKEKIFFRRVADRLIATLDTNMYYGLHTLVVMNLKPNVKENIRYFLGLFNFSLLTYYYKATFASSKTVFSEVGARQVKELPIRKIDFTSQTDKEKHDALVSLVDQMLSLNKQLADAHTDHEKTTFQRQIDATDRQIDKLVYELYGLTEEEIKIVEGNF
jgi:type I restriction-modification system DNA methylase subunit